MPSSRPDACNNRCRVCFDPRRIRQGRRAYGQCRAGHRPWPKHRRKPDRRWLVEQRETEPYSGKPKKLAERTQHDEIAAAHIAGEAEAGRSDIHERLVDDENAAAGTQLCGKSEQRFPVDEPAIRAVGIGDDGEIGIAEGGGLARLDDAMAGKARRARVLVIGRRQNGRPAAPRQPGDERQQYLRTRRRHDMRRRRRAV